MKLIWTSNGPGGDIVAPHWGAWIEIVALLITKSHGTGRTPLGCVD